MRKKEPDPPIQLLKYLILSGLGVYLLWLLLPPLSVLDVLVLIIIVIYLLLWVIFHKNP